MPFQFSRCSAKVVSAFLESSDSKVCGLAEKELRPLIDSGVLKNQSSWRMTIELLFDPCWNHAEITWLERVISWNVDDPVLRFLQVAVASREKWMKNFVHYTVCWSPSFSNLLQKEKKESVCRCFLLCVLTDFPTYGFCHGSWRCNDRFPRFHDSWRLDLIAESTSCSITKNFRICRYPSYALIASHNHQICRQVPGIKWNSLAAHGLYVIQVLNSKRASCLMYTQQTGVKRNLINVE